MNTSDTNRSNRPTPGATRKLPPITLTAVGSGRMINLAALDIPAVLILHARETASAAEEVNRAVRNRYPAAEEVLVASVVDLRAVPRFVRGLAEAAMKQAYGQIVTQLPPGMDAASYAILLPDWKGEVNAAVGVDNVNRQAGIVVLDRDGAIVGVEQGSDLAGVAVERLTGLDSLA